MGCDKRNKKLFTHIAIGSLIVVIIYIVVDAFRPKRNKLEGFGGSSSEDIIDYKVEASAWTFPPDELHVYIKAYHDKMLIEKEKRDRKKSNRKNNDDAGMTGHYSSLMENINKKLGTKRYPMDDGTDKTNLQILEKAIENDKSSLEFWERDFEKVSGFLLTTSYFENVNDKLIRGGEGSNISISKINAFNSKSGIISKDGSKVYSNDIFFEDVQIPFAAYQKKKQYNHGFLDVKNFKVNNFLVKFAKDNKSKIILNDLIQVNNKDSKKMLVIVNQ